MIILGETRGGTGEPTGQTRRNPLWQAGMTSSLGHGEISFKVLLIIIRFSPTAVAGVE
jgi:hypothetical protein